MFACRYKITDHVLCIIFRERKIRKSQGIPDTASFLHVEERRFFLLIYNYSWCFCGTLTSTSSHLWHICIAHCRTSDIHISILPGHCLQRPGAPLPAATAGCCRARPRASQNRWAMASVMPGCRRLRGGRTWSPEHIPPHGSADKRVMWMAQLSQESAVVGDERAHFM